MITWEKKFQVARLVLTVESKSNFGIDAMVTFI